MKNLDTKKPPPFLLGTSILFWAWQTELLYFGILMALILEGSVLVKFRWEFLHSDFNRISDLCALIFVGMTVYLFLAQRSVFIIFTLLKWLPLSFFPLIFCQNYNITQEIDIRAISMFFRRQQKFGHKIEPFTFNLSYPYFGICILSASFSNIREPGFYIGLILLCAWALWTIRSKRYSFFIWLLLFITAAAGGYAGHIGLNRLQHIMEIKGMEWFYNLKKTDSDPYEAITAIGQIGKLKFSNNIIFRISIPAKTNINLPILLRQASYNQYNYSRWFARYSNFTHIEPESDGTTWKIGKNKKQNQQIKISEYLQKGQGILKLPVGTFQIKNLPVLEMKKNQFGAVKVNQGPGLINYEVNFTSHSIDSIPDEDDFFIPESEQDVILKLVDKLKLKGRSYKEILNLIENFFQTNFSYCLDLKPEYSPTPLAHFLQKSRSGHCEYFATATALLLRGAGIPARYVTGFSAHEFSRLENKIIVRNSHAHAWTIAFINGTWQNIDNTPASWRSLEADKTSLWQIISDFWAWIIFKFSQWQWSSAKNKFSDYMIWLVIPLVFILARRLYLKKRISNIQKKSQQDHIIHNWPGKDSKFFEIEKKLNSMGFIRNHGETFYNWLKRIEKNKNSKINIMPLYDILSFHYKYRFDPKGISRQEKKILNKKAQKWLLS